MLGREETYKDLCSEKTTLAHCVRGLGSRRQESGESNVTQELSNGHISKEGCILGTRASRYPSEETQFNP